MMLSLILVAIGGTILFMSIRSLRAHRLKERYVIVFILVGIPFLVLAVWPDAVGMLSHVLDIEYPTVLLLGSTTFFLLTTLKLLSITSVHERHIATLTQLVGIIDMERARDRSREGSTDTA